MSVKIIVDSSADMAEEVQNSVETVPLTVRFSDREYVDGVDIDRKTFYEMLIESDELPTTSQPSPEAFKKLFRTLKNGEQYRGAYSNLVDAKSRKEVKKALLDAGLSKKNVNAWLSLT